MIEIENLSKIYNENSLQEHKALDAICLHIKKGECVILSGVSGSGKSTLLSLIAALDKPSEGKIVIDGEPISKLPDMHASDFRAKSIGIVFQHFNLLELLSVEENIYTPLICNMKDMRLLQAKALQAMQLSSIDHKRSQVVSKLSGGEKQRCAIARALVHDPKILLCDEPTANLDRENSLKFIEILQKLHQEGKTIIVATHDPLFVALPFASRVIRMQQGRIINE